MTDPVLASDSHTYDRASIMLYFAHCSRQGRSITSPMTREIMSVELKRNVVLFSAMDEMREKLQRMKVVPDSPAPPNCNFHIGEHFERSTFTRAVSSEIFESLDALIHMDLMTKLDLKPPQIVVLGSENHGKSTLLERLIGFAIFPRAATFCTRCAIRVNLRRSAEISVAKVFIRHRESGAVQEGTESHVAVGALTKQVKLFMDEMVRGLPANAVIADREIVVEIRMPYCPNLDILDLPGLIAAPHDAHEATMKLSRSVIVNESEHSIFLLVVDSHNNSNTSLATQLVLNHGIQDKTIGVFIKLDTFGDRKDHTLGSVEEQFTLHLMQNNEGIREIQIEI